MHCIRSARRLLTAFAAALALMLALSACHSSRKAGRTPAPTHIDKAELKGIHPATAKLLAEADSWIGTPYKFAGTDRKGIDCSALTLNVFRSALAITLPRNSAAQAEACSPVRRDDMIAGDLVFFASNSSRGKIGHVGIYVGDGRIIHASSSQGVVLASLDARWFNDHYRGSGRVDAYYALVNPGSKPAGLDDPLYADATPLNKEKKKKSKKDKPKKSKGDKGREPSRPSIPNRLELPSITLGQFVAANRPKASAPAVGAPDSVAAPEPVVMADARVSKPAAPVVVKIDSVAPAPVNSADARAQVINTYKELPPDSVMTSYFD